MFLHFFIILQKYLIMLQMDDEGIYQTSETTPARFTQLVNRLYTPLCFAANRFLNDRIASEDVVQEAFARLWELQSKSKRIDEIDNYMYMLVHNLSLEWLRKQKLQDNFVNSRPKEVNILNVIVEADVAMQILAEIKKLPPRSREVMELVFQGFDNPEIARRMKISINSVKTLKYKSIDKLKSVFTADNILKILLMFG